MSKGKVGDSLMDIEVIVSCVEAYHGEYTFYAWHIRKRKGVLLALPFFTHEKEQSKCGGYLIYHDKENYGYTREELFNIGIGALVSSISGNVNGLTPLPYKLISAEKIESALEELIRKNTRVDLGGDLSI